MDKRLALAMKYSDAQLPHEAWAVLRDLVADPLVETDVLRFAITLRLQAGAFDDVITLCERVGDADAAQTKAHALHRSGRLEEAEAAYRAVIASQEINPAAWNDLGNVLDEVGRADEAKACFERAIKQAPDFSPAHTNLGAHLGGRGLFAAAAQSHQRALHAYPDNTAARVNLGVALVEQRCIDGALDVFDDALAHEPGNVDAADNRLYAQLYTAVDPNAVYTAHATWGRAQPHGAAMAPHDPDPNRRLRIGYVSPDFRRHSVAFFVEPLLVRHDPATADVFCYSDVLQPDAVTMRLKATAAQWRDTGALSHDALHAQILSDHIDVLVDLAGHTKGNRLAVFARRAAPVQVAALGYPATTGLATMDYRLCDMETDPAPDADSFATEKLVRLPNGLHCYAPPAVAPAPGPLPALRNGYLTFGSFNKLAKVSATTVKIWAGILAATPKSKLVLKSKALAEEETRASITAAFAAEGIAPNRLELLGWVGEDVDHLRLYNGVDVALDTFPYNGTTTTCEALWMGVPVLTFAGKSHAARVGASLVSRVGLREWVCARAEEMPTRAATLTQHLEDLAELRRGLRALVAASPLSDAGAYARAVENAYRAMWQQRIRDS